MNGRTNSRNSKIEKLIWTVFVVEQKLLRRKCSLCINNVVEMWFKLDKRNIRRRQDGWREKDQDKVTEREKAKENTKRRERNKKKMLREKDWKVVSCKSWQETHFHFYSVTTIHPSPPAAKPIFHFSAAQNSGAVSLFQLIWIQIMSTQNITCSQFPCRVPQSDYQLAQKCTSAAV